MMLRRGGVAAPRAVLRTVGGMDIHCRPTRTPQVDTGITAERCCTWGAARGKRPASHLFPEGWFFECLNVGYSTEQRRFTLGASALSVPGRRSPRG